MRYPPCHRRAVVARAMTFVFFFVLLSVVSVVNVEGRSCRREMEMNGVCPQPKCTECQVTLSTGIAGATTGPSIPPTACARVGSRRCCKVAIDEQACLTNSFCEWDVRRNVGRCRRMRGQRRKKGSKVFDATTPFPNPNFGATTPFPDSNFGATTPFPGSNFGVTTPFPGSNFGATTPFPGSGFGATTTLSGSGFGAAATTTVANMGFAPTASNVNFAAGGMINAYPSSGSSVPTVAPTTIPTKSTSF